MIRVRQTFPRPILTDIEASIKEEIERIGLEKRIRPGQTAAVTVGSRGIDKIDRTIRCLVDELKRMGLKPYIVPAMGSHGGANEKGQAEILGHLGITENTMGCPIVSSMEVDEVARSEDGVISFVDREALNADHIVVVNRVKKHTEFEGAIESGLCKMMCIGLGNHKGTLHYHQIGVNIGLERALLCGARNVIRNANILCGIGIVENAYDEIALIRAFLPEDIEEGDKALLKKAKELSAGLPFDEADLLIIDEIGKEISGSGFDTKVVGRICSAYGPEPESPRIRRMAAMNLTDGSEGNAVGLGALDFIGLRLFNKIDRAATYVNAITAQNPFKGGIPIYYDTDLEVIHQALQTIGLVAPKDARVIRIRNTLHLSEVDVSENYLEQPTKSGNMEIIDRDTMRFDSGGFLIRL
jgi:hypothetical protein